MCHKANYSINFLLKDTASTNIIFNKTKYNCQKIQFQGFYRVAIIAQPGSYLLTINFNKIKTSYLKIYKNNKLKMKMNQIEEFIL